jgi:hypothetical protein
MDEIKRAMDDLLEICKLTEDNPLGVVHQRAAHGWTMLRDYEATQQSAQRTADWFCEECGHSNQSEQDECYFCQSPAANASR